MCEIRHLLVDRFRTVLTIVSISRPIAPVRLTNLQQALPLPTLPQPSDPASALPPLHRSGEQDRRSARLAVYAVRLAWDSLARRARPVE